MVRKLWVIGVLGVLCGSVAWPASVGAGERTVIRFATMAPRGSSFLRIFQAWGISLKKATSGRVQMRMYAGGVAGDDRDVLRKMKLQQMDGGQFSSVAMGSIVREMMLTQVPGISRGMKELQAVRTGMQDQWIKELAAGGYTFLGWSDVGFGRIFSKRPVLKPEDYRVVRPWVYKEDPIEPALMQLLEAHPIPLSLPEVFPALQTGMIDTLTVSAVAAVALQWFRHLTHMSNGNGMVLVGATMVRKELVDALPPDDREALVETSAKAHALLNEQIAKEEERAVKALKGRGIVEFDLTAHRADWDRAYGRLQQALIGRLYTAEALARAKKLAASVRN